MDFSVLNVTQGQNLMLYRSKIAQAASALPLLGTSGNDPNPLPKYLNLIIFKLARRQGNITILVMTEKKNKP